MDTRTAKKSKGDKNFERTPKADVELNRLTMGAGRLVSVLWFFRGESGGPLFCGCALRRQTKHSKEALATMTSLG
jgi:hypothetical protein